MGLSALCALKDSATQLAYFVIIYGHCGSWDRCGGAGSADRGETGETANQRPRPTACCSTALRNSETASTAAVASTRSKNACFRKLRNETPSYHRRDTKGAAVAAIWCASHAGEEEEKEKGAFLDELCVYWAQFNAPPPPLPDALNVTSFTAVKT